MDEKLKKAYELVKSKTGYDKVESCRRLSENEFIFDMNRGEEDIFNTPIDDGGAYKVDVLTGIVKPFYMYEIPLGDTSFEEAEEIDPEIFEANKLFNL